MLPARRGTRVSPMSASSVTSGSLVHPPQGRSSPSHVGIILDGNGRWARARGLERIEGHRRGAETIRVAVEGCLSRGIPFLTLYAFSVANWLRPEPEIRGLMEVARGFAEGQLEFLAERSVRVELIGEPDEIPTPTRRAMEALLDATRDGSRLTLSIALSYGGRRDLVNAMRAIAARAKAGLVVPEEITERSLRSHLSTSRVPDPDLVIRTGGEKRLSDFLLFEAAYAELFFTDRLWPDFDDETLDEAVRTFARRERRFGKTSEQVATV
jgi:undecaprenyl diphosphate synthase